VKFKTDIFILKSGHCHEIDMIKTCKKLTVFAFWFEFGRNIYFFVCEKTIVIFKGEI
jgi:hypothetical protein